MRGEPEGEGRYGDSGESGGLEEERRRGRE